MGLFSKLVHEFLDEPHHANSNASNGNCWCQRSRGQAPVKPAAKPTAKPNTPSTAQRVSEWSQALGHFSQAIQSATPAQPAKPASTGAPQSQPQQQQQ
ncbi:hypothetical protein PG993_002857 [Apiospora rasikravindrae]|uniref:Uncharacterized protein n=1 Tax=Apiospora rasikravindrae TaxID=990691 RepID=A0ABR1TY90_9PEZI